MKIQSLLLFSLVASSTFAAQTAKVMLVRGKVTALKPGSVEAIKVKKGQVLPEDTSVVTGKKSVVRLKFADKSTMNLGPKSKVVVSKMPIKKPNMINLLTGAVKAEVNKQSNKASKNKMIIKTRSAVMGVRGTKFQTSFNHSNGNTSLVTVEGNVAMVKREQGPPKKMKVIKKKAEAEKINLDSELDALDRALENSKEVVEVPAGRYSGVVEKSNKAPSAPTKIAPEQYKALAKSMNSKKKVEDVYTDKEIEQAARASTAVASDAPKAGGFVDFKTGLYVPPAKDAKKDEKTGVFVAEDLGKVNNKTGEYIAPKGVKLDAKKGFVIDQEEVAKIASVEDKAALQRTLSNIKSVNKEVKKQVVVNKMQAKSKNMKKAWWKPQRHLLKASLTPYSETISAENLSNGSQADFYSKEANLTKFIWAQNWNEKWGSQVAIGFVSYEVDDSEVSVLNNENDDNDGYFYLGATYKHSDRLNLNLGLVNQAYTFVYPSGATDKINSQRSELSYLNLGANYFLWNWRSFEIYAGASLKLFEDKTIQLDNSDDSIDIKSSGLKLNMNGLYEWKENLGLEAELFFERTKHNSDKMEWTRLSLGTGVQFFWKI